MLDVYDSSFWLKTGVSLKETLEDARLGVADDATRRRAIAF